jgi:tape measure domain-containing protein
MGQQIHELRGVISGDPSGWLRAVKQSIDAGKAFAAQWGQLASDLATVTTRIGTGAAAMATAIGTAVAVTGGKFNALKENATVAFTTILRDGAKARSFLEDLQKFAAETPFSFGGLIKNSQFLLATGTSLAEIIPTLRVLGDTLAGLGKGEAELQLVATALAQIRSSAKLSAADMAQLTNQGIPAWQMLADAIGKSVGEARKLSEAGAFSGEQAFQILTGGMKQRFGGGMAAASGTFDQMLSNLKDTFDIRAAEITGGLFGSMKKVFRDLLDYLGSGQFDKVVKDLAQRFAMAGATIEQAFGNNRQQIIQAFTDGLSGLADGVNNLVKWFRESGPALAGFTSTISDAVRAVGSFVAQYPQVVAFLAVWKGAEMLGVVSLVRTFLTLLGSGVSALASFAAAMRTGGQAAEGAAGGIGRATTAAGALRGALAAGVASAIVAGFFAVLSSAAADLREELAAVRAEAEKVRGLGLEKIRAGVQQSEGLTDPGARANALQQDLAAAQQELKLAQVDIANRRKERQTVESEMTFGDRVSALLPEGLGGFDARRERDSELAKAEARFTAASNAVSEIEAKLKMAQQQATGPGLAGQQPAPQAVAVEIDTEGPQRRAEDAVKEWNRLVEDVTNRMESMALKLADMGQYMDPGQIQMVADSMQRLGDALLNGEITQGQFGRLASGLQQVADRAGDFSEKIQTAAENGQLSADQLDALNGSLSGLLGQYQQGAITADGFRRGLADLAQTMDAATRETERQTAAEERKRLLSGQFTGDEFKTALEDRIIAFRRQQFQQLVDMQFRQWQGLNGILTDTGNRFGQLGNGMQNFGAQVQRASGFLQGFGGGGGMNWSSIAAAFNSPQAQRDMLFNELQMLLQYFRPNTSPYSMGLDPERAARYQGRIDEIQSILNAPPPPPMFTGISGDQVIGDPGLQSQSARAGGSGNFTIHAPNLTRISQSEIRTLADAMAQELQRQGRRL